MKISNKAIWNQQGPTLMNKKPQSKPHPIGAALWTPTASMCCTFISLPLSLSPNVFTYVTALCWDLWKIARSQQSHICEHWKPPEQGKPSHTHSETLRWVEETSVFPFTNFHHQPHWKFIATNFILQFRLLVSEYNLVQVWANLLIQWLHLDFWSWLVMI